MITVTPADAQAKLDAAAGPGYSITLTPGVYPSLSFNHARPCLLTGCYGATVHSIKWQGGPARGNQTVRGIDFAGGASTDTAIVITDDVSNVLVEDCTVAPGYACAFSIQRNGNVWPQPHDIRIHRLRGRGMLNLGCIVGACDSVFLDDIALDCRECTGGNGFYLHDKQASNLRLRDILCYGADGKPACGIRGAASINERIVAEGCLVNFAAGHNVQSVKGLVSVNAKRYELECGDYGPLYIADARLSNMLPAASLDQNGPGHHNINIGGQLLSRIEIVRSSAYTQAAQSGTNFASSARPAYGGVVEMGMYANRPGSAIEWGAAVSDAYAFNPTTMPAAGKTVADYATASGLTVEGVFDLAIPVREIFEFMSE